MDYAYWKMEVTQNMVNVIHMEMMYMFNYKIGSNDECCSKDGKCVNIFINNNCYDKIIKSMICVL